MIYLITFYDDHALQINMKLVLQMHDRELKLWQQKIEDSVEKMKETISIKLEPRAIFQQLLQDINVVVIKITRCCA